MASSERFGYEWDKYHQILPEYEEQFRKWVTPLKPEDFRGKTILDAGCGIGRNSYWPLRYGAKSVLAFDLDPRTVNVARRNLKQFRNAIVRSGNIYDIPGKETFDISHAIGVISHLEDPERAIRQLAKATKQGGKVIIWTLSYEGNEWVRRFFGPARFVTSWLPLSIVSKISFFLTIPVFVLVRLRFIKHPYFEQIAKYKFHHIRSIIFDHLIPKIVRYYRQDKARELLRRSGLRNIKINLVNNNSWTMIGVKPYAK
ncbi:MAG: Methylase involved in ubiquinone/menaquinone biosynthesis [Microgenomates group bacterium GW2011_GWA1_48_10]|uniref:Methyltransferase type 11 domain-containing protein n=1 Tax=Candidatus Gottesmanbacteria bacterium RIFCSPHIGHO2_01_FULL_47_48 TaxID=1798381 RepID=A0A1F6A5G7_9BACT|nr:MAG: Methylase involved in ubiquinone/menaquinone biosynthesis [Microgenomates group bacterium GW2011_GWA1_48_10]OGG19724.1 MAG: hypothetical protein A2721_01055 [Candidatus Gottesmanbacteria bacterium RIFCSPHIGHO2_01_FULL_47_48]